MILHNLFSVGIGAIFGAWFRYALGYFLNPLFPTLPLGTLLCNLLGGLVIGLIMQLTKNNLFVSEQLRLALVTGFLGSFTTFSTFSAETVHLISNQEYFWTLLIIIAHVGGSLLATLSGMILIKFILG